MVSKADARASTDLQRDLRSSFDYSPGGKGGSECEWYEVPGEPRWVPVTSEFPGPGSQLRILGFAFLRLPASRVRFDNRRVRTDRSFSSELRILINGFAAMGERSSGVRPTLLPGLSGTAEA